MSATLDTALFRDYFGAQVLRLPGRTHPVDIFYVNAPESDYCEAALIASLQVSNVNVWVGGRRRVRSCVRSLVRARGAGFLLSGYGRGNAVAACTHLDGRGSIRFTWMNQKATSWYSCRDKRISKALATASLPRRHGSLPELCSSRCVVE